MKTYTQILYQLVFGTKYRQPVLSKENRVELFKYINGLLQNKNCHAYRINGVEDHLHIVTHIHPIIAPAMLVKDIKLASSAYIREKRLFPEFEDWQIGYGAFTYSVKEKHRLIEYVKNQEAHHQKKAYREELIDLLREHEIDFDEKYLD